MIRGKPYSEVAGGCYRRDRLVSAALSARAPASPRRSRRETSELRSRLPRGRAAAPEESPRAMLRRFRGENRSRRPWTTRVGTSISHSRSRQRGVQSSVENTITIWFAICTARPVPGVRSHCAPLSCRQLLDRRRGSPRRRHEGCDAWRSAQSGMVTANSRSWPRGRGRAGHRRVGLEQPPGCRPESAPRRLRWSRTATWATIPATHPAMCARSWPSASTRGQRRQRGRAGCRPVAPGPPWSTRRIAQVVANHAAPTGGEALAEVVGPGSIVVPPASRTSGAALSPKDSMPRATPLALTVSIEASSQRRGCASGRRRRRTADPLQRSCRTGDELDDVAGSIVIDLRATYHCVDDDRDPSWVLRPALISSGHISSHPGPPARRRRRWTLAINAGSGIPLATPATADDKVVSFQRSIAVGRTRVMVSAIRSSSVQLPTRRSLAPLPCDTTPSRRSRVRRPSPADHGNRRHHAARIVEASAIQGVRRSGQRSGIGGASGRALFCRSRQNRAQDPPTSADGPAWWWVSATGSARCARAVALRATDRKGPSSTHCSRSHGAGAACWLVRGAARAFTSTIGLPAVRCGATWRGGTRSVPGPRAVTVIPTSRSPSATGAASDHVDAHLGEAGRCAARHSIATRFRTAARR